MVCLNASWFVEKRHLLKMSSASLPALMSGEREAKTPVVAATSSSQTLLEELDLRQDEVLAQLDALNLRIEQVLRECAATVQREAA